MGRGGIIQCENGGFWATDYFIMRFMWAKHIGNQKETKISLRPAFLHLFLHCNSANALLIVRMTEWNHKYSTGLTEPIKIFLKTKKILSTLAVAANAERLGAKKNIFFFKRHFAQCTAKFSLCWTHKKTAPCVHITVTSACQMPNGIAHRAFLHIMLLLSLYNMCAAYPINELRKINK